MAEKRKDYNTAALLGIPMSDLEVCEELKINSAYAHTPQIVEAAANAVFNSNVKDMIRGGMPKKDAIKEASKQRKDAITLNRKLIARNKPTDSLDSDTILP